MTEVYRGLPGGARASGRDTLRQIAHEIVACERCPRLREHCRTVARVKRAAYRDETYWGRPVPGFGDARARILLVGLAPGAHGANRTGRLFTGDDSAGFLFAALHRAGLANLPASRTLDDGLRLKDVFVSAAARCAPPDNRPLPEELERCLPFLARELVLLRRVRVILALGRIAFDTARKLPCVPDAARRAVPVPFAHGAVTDLAGTGSVLVASYHPSRQNTRTGRLTPVMLDHAIGLARRHAGLG